MMQYFEHQYVFNSFQIFLTLKVVKSLEEFKGGSIEDELIKKSLLLLGVYSVQIDYIFLLLFL